MNNPPYNKPAIPAGLKNLRGPEKGIFLFFELVESLATKQENIENLFIEVNQRLDELDRRLTIFEKRGDRERTRLLHLEESNPVRMQCIACFNTFQIPEQEAKKLKYLTTCPACRNWAISPSDPNTRSENIAGFSIRHVADKLNLKEWAVRARARELGLKGYNFRFSKEDIERIKQLQSAKKRGRPRK